MQSSSSAVSDLQRLHQQQAKILEGIDARLTQLRRFADDYKAIDGFMEDLPKRLSYSDAIIPFGGTKGLVRGQLVNTNEVMVFLGADHFATMTCYQARQLISRRSKSIDLQIDACSEERRLFAERINFTSAFTKEQVGGAGGGVVDIKEEVNDEEEEKKWMDRHRQFLQQKKQEKQCDDDEELWRRLEQLEMEEDEDEDEEKTIEIVETKKEDVHGILLPPRRKSTDRTERHVRFSVTDDQDDDDDDEDGGEERTAVIRFRHSPTAETAAASESITPASIVQSHRQGAGDCVPALAASVVERQTDVTTDSASEASTRRPVSRFRAQRLGKSI